MSDLFNFKTRRNHFAVMGNPIAHSRSPRIHDLFARQFDITMHYDRIQVDAGGFAQAVSHFAAHGGGGLNVTLPFKVDAFQLCARAGNELSARANRAQAVNTLSFGADGEQIIGDNTDGIGLVRDIENCGVAIAGRNVLVLGAGGAVRGILWHLAECQPATLTVTNRTESKARELAAQLHETVGITVTGCGFDRIDGEFDVVINGTSAGVTGDRPNIPATCIGEQSFVYDMMYATAKKSPTAFLHWATEHGAGNTRDGLGMLVEQAAESFSIWHGKMPETKSVLAALRDE